MNTVYRISSILVLFCLLIVTGLTASDLNEKISKNLTSLLGSASEGTEFYLTFHPSWTAVTTPTNKILIYVSSSTATKVTLKIPGKSIAKEQTCLANQVIVFELTPAEAQCYVKTSGQEPSAVLGYPGYGIIITSEEPVVCYGLSTSSLTSEGFLAIPKVSLGCHYIVSSYNSPTTEDSGQYLTSYTSIVGVYPDTKVDICIGGSPNNYTEKPSSFRNGSTTTITLQPGDVYLIGVKGDYNDLTGTRIDATKPVSVISGSYGTLVPKEVGYSNYLIEQDIPISAWGTQCQIMPITGRQKPSIMRVMASEPNTKLYINGNEWATIKTAGGAMGDGYVEARAQAEGDNELNPITISANSPIAVTQFNPGSSDDDVSTAPFQINITPVEQYQNEISWTIPAKNGEAIAKENYVNICYFPNGLAKIPDDILFGQSDGTDIVWKKLADLATPGKVLYDDKLPEGQYWKGTSLELFNPAYVYYLKGNNKMAVYCYGTGDATAYGYSAISNFKDVSKNDIYKPSLTYNIDCGGIIHGKVSDEPINDESLRTNLKVIKLLKDQSYNIVEVNNNWNDLISSITSNWEFSLNILDKNLQSKAVIYASDCAGNDTTFTIEYFPVILSLDKKVFNFGGNFVNGPVKTITCELTNYSDTTVILDSIRLKSNNNSSFKFAGFTVNDKIYKKNGGKLPNFSLYAGQKFSFDVTFDPLSVKDDFIAGKNEFIDSIYLKAYTSKIPNDCGFSKYVAQVIGYVQFLDTLPPKPTYTQCCCGNTVSGNVLDEPANDPANRSNLTYIGLVKDQSYNCSEVKYDESAFIPGKTSSIDWEVSTIVHDEDGKAVILFSDRAGNDTTISIDLIITKIALDSKVYDYEQVYPLSHPISKKMTVTNLSNKDIVLDSIILISADKARGLPKSGFKIDPSAYKANGGLLPQLTLKTKGTFQFYVIFDPQSIQDEVESGKKEFQDSVGFKANWNSDHNLYCFNEYKALVTVEITPVAVNDESSIFGITDISPNPVNNSSVNIKYNLDYDCNVELSLYNSTGMMIKSILSEYQTSGNQAFTLSVNDFPAGIYFVEFRAGTLVGHKSFVIVK